MSLTVLAYRDDVFPGNIDSYLWRQLGYAFNIKVNFIESAGKYDSSLIVVFDETGDIPLSDFIHPKNSIYVFGATGMDEIQNLHPDAPSVRIEIPNIVPEQGMYGHQVASIVLYDRSRKSWQ